MVRGKPPKAAALQIDSKAQIMDKLNALERSADAIDKRRSQLIERVSEQKAFFNALSSLRTQVGGTGNFVVTRNSRTNRTQIYLKIDGVEHVSSAIRYTTNENFGEESKHKDNSTSPTDNDVRIEDADDAVQPRTHKNLSEVKKQKIVKLEADFPEGLYSLGFGVNSASQRQMKRRQDLLMLDEENEKKALVENGVYALSRMFRACRLSATERRLFDAMAHEAVREQTATSSAGREVKGVRVVEVRSKKIVVQCGSASGKLSISLNLDEYTATQAENESKDDKNTMISASLQRFLRIVALSALTGSAADMRSVGRLALQRVASAVWQSSAMTGISREIDTCCRDLGLRVQWFRRPTFPDRSAVVGGIAKIFVSAKDGDGGPGLLATFYVFPPSFKLRKSISGDSKAAETHIDAFHQDPELSLAGYQSTSFESMHDQGEWLILLPAISSGVPSSFSVDASLLKNGRYDIISSDAPRGVKLGEGCQLIDASSHQFDTAIRRTQITQAIHVVLCSRLLNELEYAAKYVCPLSLDVDRQAFSLYLCDSSHRTILAKVRPNPDVTQRPQVHVFVNIHGSNGIPGVLYSEGMPGDEQSRLELHAIDLIQPVSQSRIRAWLDAIQTTWNSSKKS